ncbi:hypothetical protein JG688_00013749 [Phytophthora aleatoria]|uniref:Uncharacterized protein n=1 Tax=Phytophthora aleatoria TaxID=2496075 RepID=A0A8J5ILQ3_9STRA|nr:hypothetical protein JG688_00013749 [Phytophthora aleatoria]
MYCPTASCTDSIAQSGCSQRRRHRRHCCSRSSSRGAVEETERCVRVVGGYEFGLNGLKPVKEFTAAERGTNKFTYSRRKIFWDVVAGFVRAGFTSDIAIDKVFAAYSRQLPVTKV